MSEIVEQIKQLKQEATNKGIFHMASEIAKAYGTEHPKKHGSWFDWMNDEMQINYDNYGSNIFINYRGVVVFNAQLSEVIGYRPDIPDWIEKLTKFYEEKVSPLTEQKEKERKNARANELFNSWGITTPSIEGN